MEMMPLIKAYISVGSNIGDKRENLDFAVKSLERGGTVLQVSPCFETEPVGYGDQPWFLNIAVEMETSLDPFALLALCMEIEQSRGRTREFPNAPRTLDLDILFFGDRIIRKKDLIVPHPRLSERKFVLEPMSRIAPGLVHPLFRKTIQSLLEECKDPSQVRLCI